MAAEYEVNIKINTQEIERELKKVDKAVNNIGKGKDGKKQSILALPSTEMLNATARKIQGLDKVNRKVELRQREVNKQTRDQALNINTLVRTQDKRARLLNKINEMEAKGLNVSKLRKQLGKATTEQSARRFGSAEKEFRVLEKSIRLEQSKLRILKEQRKGFPSSPIRGTRTMMGSPAQIAASGRQLASPIRGGLGFPGSPAFLAGATASRTPFGPAGSFPQVLGGLPTGGAALPVGGSISIPGSPKAIQAAKATNLRAVKVEASWAKALGELQETAKMLEIKDSNIKRSWSTALAELSETAALIKVRSQQANAGLTGQASPIGGATNIPGSPAFLRRQRRNRTLEQVGLGAGFPLLFGGGPGAVLGGGLGGVTGSFGAQIAFSALGQQIDQLVGSVINAGKAITSVEGAFGMMTEKSLFSSDAMQFRIEKLLEEGRVTEAAALMTQEMAKQVGGTGLKALKDLGTEASKMGKLFGTLMLRVQAFMANALTPLIKLINSALGRITAQSQLDQMLAEAASPEQRAQIAARAAELRGSKRVGKAGIGAGDLTPEIISILQKEYPAVIPKGAAIEPTGLEVLRAADKGSDKAAREKERIDKRINRLEEERKKVLEISRFKDRIAAAEAAEDPQLAIRLKGEQKIAEIEAQRKKDLVGITTQREADQINILSATKKLAAQRDTERQITEEQNRRTEIFENKLATVENEGRLLQAQLDGRLEEEQLLINIEQLTKDMSGPRAQQLENQLRQNEALRKQVELSEKLDQVYEQIESTLATGLSSALQSVITKTESLGDAVRGVLVDIGNMLLRMGIETAVKAGFSALTSGGSSPAPYTPLPGSVPLIAATGAYVSGPTNAVIGEGGQGEYVIPESKMRESMARYSRGARGSSVIPESGEAGTVGGSGGTAVAAPIDVRYTVERINDVEYVTAAQFQAGMQQAAAQGAQRGEQQTLRRLQMSGSTRRRIGL